MTSFSQFRDALSWSGAEYYRQANAQLPPPAQGEKRVVFFGDSITEGWLLPEFFPKKSYLNRGISGQTTFQMLIRFRSDVVELKPKAVVILAGTNDLAQNDGPTTLTMIQQNLASMAEIAHSNQIKVILASVLPADRYDWSSTNIDPRDSIAELNTWMKKYALRNDFTYLDYYSEMVDATRSLPIEFSSDGVHPSEKGYQFMTPLAERAIQQALTD